MAKPSGEIPGTRYVHPPAVQAGRLQPRATLRQEGIGSGGFLLVEERLDQERGVRRALVDFWGDVRVVVPGQALSQGQARERFNQLRARRKQPPPDCSHIRCARVDLYDVTLERAHRRDNRRTTLVPQSRR